MATRTALPLLEDEREQIRANLEALSDQELVGMLMATHKLVEGRATGWVHDMAQRETVMITTVLARFAPEAFAAELAKWDATPEDEMFEIAPFVADGPTRAQDRLDVALDGLEKITGRLSQTLTQKGGDSA